jgi:hypothetical protein
VFDTVFDTVGGKGVRAAGEWLLRSPGSTTESASPTEGVLE